MTFEDALVHYFGITEDFNECGFILHDGRFLDFSGRHLIKDPILRKESFQAKIIEHYDIFGENHAGFSLEDLLTYFKIDIGNYPLTQMMYAARMICVNNYCKILRACTQPTEAQYSVLDKYFSERSVYLSYLTNDGRIIDDCELRYVTLRSLRSWFSSCEGRQPTSLYIVSPRSFLNFKSSSKLESHYGRVKQGNIATLREIRYKVGGR